MVDANAVPLEPIMMALAPYVISIGGALTTAFVGWVAANYHKRTNLDMTDASKASLQAAINTAAGAIFAAGERGISTEVIHMTDPRITVATNTLEVYLPKIIESLGITPDGIAKQIQGRLGELQASAPAVVAPPAATPGQLPAG